MEMYYAALYNSHIYFVSIQLFLIDYLYKRTKNHIENLIRFYV